MPERRCKEPSPAAAPLRCETSAGCRRPGRQLQRWTPEEGAEDPLEGPSLQLDGRPGQWDQFATNEQRFGVRTSYDEDLYTTKLDRGRSKISQEEAARIAAEIERGAPAAPRGAAQGDEVHPARPRRQGMPAAGAVLHAGTLWHPGQQPAMSVALHAPHRAP